MVDLLGSAVETGFEPVSSPAAGGASHSPAGTPRRIPVWPVTIGLAAAVSLVGFYVAVIGVVQDFEHALGLVTGDWYFVIPIALGFGTQVGLFIYARNNLHSRGGTRSTKLLGGAGTGTSTVSMIACCAHHLADVLPVLGLSAAAVFLNDYRGPLMGLGILSNIVGIVWMLRLLRKSLRLGPAVGSA